jgi:protease IV
MIYALQTMNNEVIPMSDNIAPPSSWEKETIQKVLLEAFHEQRRARRWKLFFRFIYLMIFIFIIGLMVLNTTNKNYYTNNKAHVAVIHVRGTLEDEGDANAETINESLDDAFADTKAMAVMLTINSPGGSPVQANEVYTHLRYLEKKHPDKKVYAVCTDVCASGAYYIAAGANEIYADKASLVGSIGVLMNGFGFVDTLQKIGAERRLMTAGSEKGFLDPFSPVKPQDQAYMQSMLDNIHQQFIDAVKTGRGNRLKEDPLLFSGLVWTGEQAAPLGLIDGVATPEQVGREIIKNENYVDYTQQSGFFDKFAKNIGVSASTTVASALNIPRGFLR